MRLFTKFFALCALALCSILFSGGFIASHHYYRRVLLPHSKPKGSSDGTPAVARRLVVFGDSWSDSNAAPIKGSVWTDRLCSEVRMRLHLWNQYLSRSPIQLSCEQDNLAETAKSIRGTYIGSVVDNGEFSSMRTLFGLYRSPVADFKHQARQWLDTESEVLRAFSDDEIRQRRDNTIFVVSFGVWDIWNLVGVNYKKATASVDRSIAVLMQQLDLVSEGWEPSDFRVIVTRLPNVTIFPAFKSTTKGDPTRAKDTSRVIQYWNDRLGDALAQWAHGTVYLFDTNAFMTDLIRDFELSVAGVEEDGLGANNDPGWENVYDPCVTTRQQWVVMVEESQCENPEKYLFW